MAGKDPIRCPTDISTVCLITTVLFLCVCVYVTLLMWNSWKKRRKRGVMRWKPVPSYRYWNTFARRPDCIIAKWTRCWWRRGPTCSLARLSSNARCAGHNTSSCCDVIWQPWSRAWYVSLLTPKQACWSYSRCCWCRYVPVVGMGLVSCAYQQRRWPRAHWHSTLLSHDLWQWRSCRLFTILLYVLCFDSSKKIQHQNFYLN